MERNGTSYYSVIAVDGNSAGGVFISVFTVNSGVTAAISNLTIQHSDTISGGIVNTRQ
jgi:hypothetical protein